MPVFHTNAYEPKPHYDFNCLTPKLKQQVPYKCYQMDYQSGLGD